MRRKIGFIINPIAGMGGSVGLKGTDGQEVLQQARRLGAVPRATERARQALEKLLPVRDQILLYTWSGCMGELVGKEMGFSVEVLGGEKAASCEVDSSCQEDTREAAAALLREGAELLMFAGGDGTARDICSEIGQGLPVVGIPAGVKIHSAVYGVTPVQTGNLVRRWVEGENLPLKEGEVMDIDEAAFRQGIVTTRLYGYMRIPYRRSWVQGGKKSHFPAEEEGKMAIAQEVVERMEENVMYIIGPGSTTLPVMEKMGMRGTLLGVDVIKNGKLLGNDVGEEMLLQWMEKEAKCRIVVTPIGGQGFLFGRGNQQISHKVIAQVGKEGIMAVATRQKIQSFHGEGLLVDTGDNMTDGLLRGYIRVIVGYREEVMCKVD